MSLRCNICGEDVSYEGGYETSYGFVCFDCHDAKNFQLCAECGRRFPRDDMIEWHGLLYCRSDYFSVKERYERTIETDRKKKGEREAKNKATLAKVSGLIPVRSSTKARLTKEDVRALMEDVNRRASPKHGKLDIYKESQVNGN